jgi:hypothetical protein
MGRLKMTMAFKITFRKPTKNQEWIFSESLFNYIPFFVFFRKKIFRSWCRWGVNRISILHFFVLWIQLLGGQRNVLHFNKRKLLSFKRKFYLNSVRLRKATEEDTHLITLIDFENVLFWSFFNLKRRLKKRVFLTVICFSARI